MIVSSAIRKEIDIMIIPNLIIGLMSRFSTN